MTKAEELTLRMDTANFLLLEHTRLTIAALEAAADNPNLFNQIHAQSKTVKRKFDQEHRKIRELLKQ